MVKCRKTTKNITEPVTELGISKLGGFLFHFTSAQKIAEENDSKQRLAFVT